MDESLIWPPDLHNRQDKLTCATHASALIASLCPQRRVVVQAGGCAGLWPRALATHFEAVYTFEPDATNYACLTRNCTAPNILPFLAALGVQAGTTGLSRPKAGAGLWRMDGPGNIPVLTIDSLVLPACDALVLDVEGSEVAVLDGAVQTIERHRPLLWLEYLRGTPAIDAWLTSHGYDPPIPTLGRDVYSRPAMILRGS